MLGLLIVALWFILRGDFFYVLTLCYFVLLFFSPFSIEITLLGKEKANFSAFRTFVRFVLVWLYRFGLADLFLYNMRRSLYKVSSKQAKKHLAQQFNFTYRYMDDVLSLKNTKFAEYLEFIYPREHEITETTETPASSSYLDCYLYIDNGKLTTRLYDKRDDFNFPIVNFPFLSSNIPSAPAYGVYVSQLIRYSQNLFKLSGLHGAWEKR